MKHYDLIVLQEIWVFLWDLAVPSTLGIDVNSSSLSSIDVTNGIKAGRPYGGITFIWHRYFGCNIQVNRYESDRILGLSVTMNGSSILFINVCFPVAYHAEYEEYIMCLGILSSILESHEEDHLCILGDFTATPGSSQFNEICDMLNENNVMFSDMVFFQVTLTQMSIMVVKHVHGWIILQCPMFCPSLLLTIIDYY